MVEKDKTAKSSKGKNLEDLKEEIAQKGIEIEHLQKSVDDLRKQIKGKEKTDETVELGRMVEDVSGLLNAGFSIFGAQAKVQNETSKGLFELINELSKLSEKAQSTHKTVNFGRGGVIDFHVSSRPLKGTTAPQHPNGLKISRPKIEAPKTQIPMTSPTETISERQPIVDVFEEEDYIKVTAELPGVKESEISLKVQDTTLTISSEASDRTYFKEVELSTPVEKEITESSYHNGILEVKLTKTKKDT